MGCTFMGKINKLKSEPGSVLVEFALISMILILLLAGIIQFGLVFNTLLILEDAARNTARSAAISTLPDNMIIANVINSLPSMPLSPANIVVTPASGQRVRGQMITVTINYDFQVPVTFGVFPKSYPLTAQASMVREI